MANDIATQTLEQINDIEKVVIALGNLSGLASVVDGNTAGDFADLHFYVYQQLEAQWKVLQSDLRERVVPYVADIRSVKLA